MNESPKPVRLRNRRPPLGLVLSFREELGKRIAFEDVDVVVRMRRGRFPRRFQPLPPNAEHTYLLMSWRGQIVRRKDQRPW